MATELSVLIVNYNTWHECVQAIDTLRKNPPTRPDGSVMPYEVIVIDNASPQRDPAAIEAVRDQLAAVAAEMGEAGAGQLILHDENLGYSRGVNACFHESCGKWILVSNPDLLFTPHCISTLQRHMERDTSTGCAVPKGFWDVDYMGRLPPNIVPTIGDLLWTTLGEFSRKISRRHSRRQVRLARDAWEAEAPHALGMMSGCLFLIEREFFERIGLMDERFPLYYEDADLSLRIRKAGRRVVQVPDSHLVHLVNRSGQTDWKTMMERHDISRRLYYRKWYGLPGLWLLTACEGFARSRLGQKLAKTPPHGPCTDLGVSSEKPVIRLPRPCDRFLLQMSLDARFYLSGGVFGSGDSWTPSDYMFASFGPTTYYYRAFDLRGDEMVELGVWKYGHVKPAPVAVAAAAESDA